MDKTQNLSTFIDQIRWLHEPEYGDFKRKVGLYITRAESALEEGPRQSVHDLFAKMRHQLLYEGTGNVEETRFKTLVLAEQIRDRLSARH